MAEDGRSSYRHLRSSSESLSLPSYSLRENRNGDLISMTKEKVQWPQRPATGKYSTLESKKSRCRRRQQSATPIPSDVIDPACQEESIYSAFLKASDSDVVADLFTDKDLTETTYSRILMPSEVAYAILGREAQSDVVKKLDERLTTILFEDADNKLQLALYYEQKTYILRVVEMHNDTTTWGISNGCQLPEVSFFSLDKLVKFYSFHPLAAFLHL